MTFFRFIASPAGRVLRVVAGLVLTGSGLLSTQGPVRWIITAIGLVPLLAGVFDWCVLAPLFGLPFEGQRLRQEVESR